MYDKIYRVPTEIYKTDFVYTLDGLEIEISPLKIKYMKQFMIAFNHVKESKNDLELIDVLSECVRVAMRQYCPGVFLSVEDVQERFEIGSIYKIIEFAAGIKLLGEGSQQSESSEQTEESSWEELDLAKLETEVFLLGNWKNYEELESSVSIQELMAILSTSRELDYEEKKFLAALQGVDLEGESDSNKGQKEWEDMKARVFSRGQAADSSDIVALQGQNAKTAGFGIGMGLDYEVVKG